MLIADDVRNTGQVTAKCVEVIREAGGTPIAVVCICDRLESIADPGATTIVYMPVKTHAAFEAAAIAAGLDAATPAVAVINATRPDETVIAATIADLPQRLAAAVVTGPAVVMIGSVFACAVTADETSAPSASRAAG